MTTAIARENSLVWCLYGQCHRTDGPAVEHTNGSRAWYLNGQLHRTDGPAVECADGYKAWFLNDVEYSREDFYKALKELQCKL